MTNSGATPKMKVHCRGGILAAPTEKFHVNAKRSLAQMGVPKPELGDERVYGAQCAPNTAEFQRRGDNLRPAGDIGFHALTIWLPPDWAPSSGEHKVRYVRPPFLGEHKVRPYSWATQRVAPTGKIFI